MAGLSHSLISDCSFSRFRWPRSPTTLSHSRSLTFFLFRAIKFCLYYLSLVVVFYFFFFLIFSVFGYRCGFVVVFIIVVVVVATAVADDCVEIPIFVSAQNCANLFFTCCFLHRKHLDFTMFAFFFCSLHCVEIRCIFFSLLRMTLRHRIPFAIAQNPNCVHQMQLAD